MPSPTSSRLTFETGARLKGGFKGRWAAERVISDTTLSLLKPASYAGTFSRDFVSRLGIGPGSFAAKRGGRDASGTSRKHRSLRSPLEAVLNRRILACSGERTTDSPRARSGRLHSLVLAAPAQRGPEVVSAKSDMRMVLALLTSLRSFSSFWHGIARKQSLLVLRASVATKR